MSSPTISTSAIVPCAEPIDPAPVPPPNTHLMVTRSKNHISKPKAFSDGTTRYLLPHALPTTDLDTVEPNCYPTAIKHQKW